MKNSCSLGWRLLPVLLLAALSARAQTGSVGIGTTAPDASAALDIVSSSKGALLPRVSAVTAVATPATGLIVFQTNSPAGYYYNAGTPAAPSWQQLATVGGGTVTASNGLTKTGQTIALGGTLTQATTLANAGFALNVTGAGTTGFAGSVGIGTTAPAQTLDVLGTARITAPGPATNASNSSGAPVAVSSSFGQSFTLPAGAVVSGLAVATNGISSASLTFYQGAPGGPVLGTQSGIALNGGFSPTTIALSTPIAIATAGTYSVVLVPNAAGQALASSSDVYAGGNAYLNGSATAGDLFFSIYTTPPLALQTTSAGQVGIGTATPTAALDVSGSTRLRGLATAGFVATDASGNLSSSGTTGSSFINNTTTQQTADFNISGTGAVGSLAVAGALTGTGADLGTAVGVGIRADGGLNLGQNTTGNNIYLGYQAGNANTGSNNQFIGYQSGLNNTTGSQNLFSGYQSGYSTTTGGGNLFIGYQSGYNTTSGGGNQFIGYQSGLYNTTGNGNQFIGYQSGLNNTTGSNNEFIGNFAGVRNTTGAENQFIGIGSGSNNTTGNTNVFSGYQSGLNNTTGAGNLFSGAQSGMNNSTGNFNSFSGNQAGPANTTGSQNVFSGNQSGYYNTTGNTNVFTGNNSGNYNTTGTGNVFNGHLSGQYNSTGNGNTALGYLAGPGAGFDALSNTTALGSFASVTTSNTIQLGNAGISSLRCQVGLTATSDARFKYDVRDDVPGLAFIERLRPVSYRFDQARLDGFTRTGTLAERSAPDPAAALHTGFLAQEVEQAAQALGFGFDGLHAPANARDYYGLNYAQFVVPLVRAVQEQQAQIEALQAQNAALQARATAAETQAIRATATLETFEARLRRLEAAGEQAQR